MTKAFGCSDDSPFRQGWQTLQIRQIRHVPYCPEHDVRPRGGEGTRPEYGKAVYSLVAAVASSALVGVMPSTPAEDGPCTSPT